MRFFLSSWLLSMLWTSQIGQAATIVEVTAATGSVASPYVGQSFTTPSGGPWDDITFNFFCSTSSQVTCFSAPGAPVAVGTAYIFTAPYTGTVGDLGTAGALAASTGTSGGVYVFAASVTLQPGITYYLYENANLGYIEGQLSTGTFYDAAGGPFGFGSATGTINYEVSGNEVSSVPEPTATYLTGIGLFGLLGWRGLNGSVKSWRASGR